MDVTIYTVWSARFSNSNAPMIYYAARTKQGAMAYARQHGQKMGYGRPQTVKSFAWWAVRGPSPSDDLDTRVFLFGNYQQEELLEKVENPRSELKQRP